MMHEKMRRGDRGVVLIVIVGVLAMLSLLAATFGMIARLELAASRNQTEYEMAREAAHAGAEYLINALQSWLNGSADDLGRVADLSAQHRGHRRPVALQARRREGLFRHQRHASRRVP